jgi:hypothetical protein
MRCGCFHFFFINLEHASVIDYPDESIIKLQLISGYSSSLSQKNTKICVWRTADRFIIKIPINIKRHVLTLRNYAIRKKDQPK